MARTAESSKWYNPLFAGTEIVQRSGNLTQIDPGSILGNFVPSDCTVPGLVLWLDAKSQSTIKSVGGVYQWWDRSQAHNNAAQLNEPLRPTNTGTSVSFED